MKKLTLITGNPHKVEEVNLILQNLGLNKDFVVQPYTEVMAKVEIPEIGTTLTENAMQKAYYFWSRNLKEDCFAEDSGLFVESLDGEPGVYSARYGGESLTSIEQCELVLSNLAEAQARDPKLTRKAEFRACIALIFAGELHYFHGKMCGYIAESISEGEGFGYDPIFIPDGYEQPLAKLGQELKNKLSHRRDALEKMLNAIKHSNF